MGTTYGRQVLDQVGASIGLSADSRPEMKPGGVTLDWGTITAVGADTQLEDGVLVPNGEKYVRYGQMITRIVAPAQVQTLTITGTPTGGTFTLTGTNPITGVVGTTAAIAYNATAATVQTALEAIFGVGNVTGGGGALPGTPVTVTFQGAWGNTPAVMTANITGLTGGTPAYTLTITTPGAATGGNFGPYDPAATDGRQTITKGDCFLVNETVREIDAHSNHVPALQGGLVWKDRLIATTGTHTLAAGPTFTELEAAFSRLRYAKN